MFPIQPMNDLTYRSAAADIITLGRTQWGLQWDWVGIFQLRYPAISDSYL